MQDSTTSLENPAAQTDSAAASPCVGVCRLDARQICLGCGRHIVEIAAAGVAAEQARVRRLKES